MAVCTAADLDLPDMQAGATPAAFARPARHRIDLDAAEVVVRARFVNQRLAPRAAVARALGVDDAKVRVIAPAVDGGFGARIATYPENVALAAVARRLERPVRHVETRSESMLAMTHGRGQAQEVELGATADGRLTGLRVHVTADGGAYPGEAGYLPAMTRRMATGVYRIPAVEFSSRVVVTNTTPVAAYRGAGRPEASALLERAMDLLASALGLDPAELRRRNLIPAGAFPWKTPTGVTYDSGDYRLALDRVLEAAGYDALRAEQAARRRRGDRLALGIGLSAYVEITAGTRRSAAWRSARTVASPCAPAPRRTVRVTRRPSPRSWRRPWAWRPSR